MLKDKKEWPEHTSWWDRNELKINIVLWGVFFGLLTIGRLMFTRGDANLGVALIWMVLFMLDLFLLWITAESPFK